MTENTERLTVQLKIRVREPLRAELARAAEERGLTLAGEIVARLEASAREHGIFDQWMQDASLRNMAFLMTSALVRAGREAAADAGISEEPKVWLERSDTYRKAIDGVARALGIEK